MFNRSLTLVAVCVASLFTATAHAQSTRPPTVIDLTPLQRPVNGLVGGLFGLGLPAPATVVPNLSQPLGPLLNPVLAGIGGGAPSFSSLPGLPSGGGAPGLPALPGLPGSGGAPQGLDIPGLLSISGTNGLQIGLLSALNNGTKPAVGVNLGTLPTLDQLPINPGPSEALDISGVLDIDATDGLAVKVLSVLNGNAAPAVEVNLGAGGASGGGRPGLPAFSGLPSLPVPQPGNGSSQGLDIPGVLAIDGSNGLQVSLLSVLNGDGKPGVGVNLGTLPTADQLQGILDPSQGVGISGLLDITATDGLSVKVLGALNNNAAPAVEVNLGSGSGLGNLTPVPEASTWMMMGLGLFGVAAAARRRS